MDIIKARLLIKDIKKNYDLIAHDFDRTRTDFWPELNFLKDFFNPGQNVLDFGCGNGRFFGLIKEKDVNYYGVDISQNLLKIAQERHREGNFYLIDESLKLPFENNFFDIVVSLATFHHMPSDILRRLLLKEFYRVLKPNGILILAVWDFYHGKNRKYLFKSHLHWLKNIFLKNPFEMERKDIFLPWKDKTGTVLGKRYFHIFSQREIKNLLLNSGFKVKEIKILPHNHKKNYFNILAISQKNFT